MNAPGQRDRQQVAEAWWALIARVVAFIFGCFLITQQATMPNPPGAQLVLVVVGIGCMGPTVATTVAMVADALRGVSRDGGGEERK